MDLLLQILVVVLILLLIKIVTFIIDRNWEDPTLREVKKDFGEKGND